MKDGTTIIAMKYNGGIILGADGRSSSVSFDFLICFNIIY
jgi:20S proteasome alpha/beta subunit